LNSVIRPSMRWISTMPSCRRRWPVSASFSTTMSSKSEPISLVWMRQVTKN